jgi:hypothetical protein
MVKEPRAMAGKSGTSQCASTFLETNLCEKTSLSSKNLRSVVWFGERMGHCVCRREHLGRA